MRQRNLVPVSQAAQTMGVSRQRIMQRIHNKSVRGQKIGNQWVVDASTLRPPSAARPLSSRMAWALAGAPVHLAPEERRRTRDRIKRLEEQPKRDRARLMQSWLAKRGELLSLEVNPNDLAELRGDGRLLLSGISDPRAGLSSGRQLEAYIPKEALQSFADDYFIDLEAGPSSPNVLLRVVHCPSPPEMAPDPHWNPRDGVAIAPLLLSITDLLDRQGTSRDNHAAMEMMEKLGQ